MSYILDALRKSDQERQRGAAPTLLATQAAAPAPRQAPLATYGAIAFALIGTGIAIGWLRPWQTEPTSAARVVAKEPEAALAPLPAAAPALVAPAVSQPPAVPAAAPSLTTPAAPVAPSPSPHATAADKPHVATHALGDATAAKPAPAPDATLAARAPEATPKAVERMPKPLDKPPPPAPAPKILAMSDLPDTIRQELPPMSITVHAYSAKPADRLVGINNRLLHEGDDVAPGLKLEQIVADGIVLNFKGYSFRRGVH